MINTILSFDLWFENFLVSVRTPFWADVFRGITFFGNTTTVIGIAVVVGIFLLRSKISRTYIAGLGITLIGAAGSVYVLKELIGRVRPDGLIPLLTETSFSFPSGHATMAMACYGFIAYFFCKLYPHSKQLILIGTALVVLSIGFSRLYLGVHFPTDVIAGYLVGGVWLWIGIQVTKKLRN